MTESEAINRLIDHFRIHDDGRPTPYLDDAVSIALKALEKQIAKKPIFSEDKQFALCPYCDGKGLFDKQKHCDNCGQKLDWSDEK